MSESNSGQNDALGADTPKLEPWLAVMLLAMVPMLVALAVRELLMHMATVSGILFAAAIGMLVVQERRRR